MGSPGTGEEDETSLAGLAGGLCRLTFFRTPDSVPMCFFKGML